LERKREQLEQQGIRIAAISNDTVATLKYFSDRVGIGYPLLSDAESAIIKRFGVLNTSVAADHQNYGIPNPVEFLVNPDRTVRAKYFEESIRDRFTGGQILVTELGGAAGGATKRIETDHLKATTWASDAIVRGGNLLSLGIDVELGPKMHVYAPGVEGYLAIDWSMTAADGVEILPVRYPESHRIELPAINEVVPVYEGSFRLLRDIHVGQPDAVAGLLDPQSRFTLRGKFRYQACDDKLCYLPQSLDLSWTLEFEQHDRTRAPEAVRRKP
jgi:hypothetical protein